MTIEGEHGQFGFSDEEMEVDVPKKNPESEVKNTEQPAIPESQVSQEKLSNPHHSLLSAEVGTMLDPNPKRGEVPKEISIHEYLLREIDNGWEKAHQKADIARVILARFDRDPDAIRALAEAYRTTYIQKLEHDIDELKRELEESVDKNDDVYNPRATAEQDHLRLAINESEKSLVHKKLVAMDIAHGLEKIAGLI